MGMLLSDYSPLNELESEEKMPTTIHAKTGSILDHSLAEGIAVFIPEGLTAIKPDAQDFFKQMCGKKMEGAFSFAPVSTQEGKLKYLYMVDNSERRITSLEDMQNQIYKVLDEFARLGVKSVAMNGIRFDERPDRNIRPEQYQRRMIEEYSAAHPEVFDEILLVDLNGGFER